MKIGFFFFFISALKAALLSREAAGQEGRRGEVVSPDTTGNEKRKWPYLPLPPAHGTQVAELGEVNTNPSCVEPSEQTRPPVLKKKNKKKKKKKRHL